RSLRGVRVTTGLAAGPETLQGIAGSPGVAIGKAVVFGSPAATHAHRYVPADEVEGEIGRFLAAVDRAQQDLREMAKRVEDRRAEVSILEAYVLMVGDETLADLVRQEITRERRCAEWAVASAIEVTASRLAALDDPYLRERSHDVEFVGERLLRALGGRTTEGTLPRLDGPSIIGAKDPSPAAPAGVGGEAGGGVHTAR